MGDNWKTHAKNLASQGWRVHLIDQRNHRRSFWSTAFGYQEMAEDLLNYLTVNHLNKQHFWAFYRVEKLLCFCLFISEKVNQLIVADIAPSPIRPTISLF